MIWWDNWIIRSLLGLPTIGWHLAEEVAEAISRHDLEPGDELPTIKVAARQSGVSAAPIRESRQHLSTAGLISVRHGSGAVITPGTEWSSAEHLGRVARRALPEHQAEVRAYLAEELRYERTGARAGARARDPAKLAELAQAQAAFVHVALRTAPDQPSRDYDCADYIFHQAIVGLSGNPAQARLGAHAQGVLLEEALLWRRTAADICCDLLEHTVICSAIASGDPEQAAAATTAHLRSVAGRRTARGTWW